MGRRNESRKPPSAGTGARAGADGKSAQTPYARFKQLLDKPVCGASLAVLRISMGLLMLLEAWSLCRSNPDAISMGTTPIETYYAGSHLSFNFPYPAFEWLPFLPTSWMYVLVALMALASVSLAAGFRCRFSSATLFLIWAYFFAIESTRSYWQSHYYLELLFTFLIIWMPTGARFSVDALLARKQGRPWTQTVPFWTVFVLRGQLVIAYFYAGVAKLNKDWLLDAIPVRWFLSDAGVLKPYERWLSEGQAEVVRGVLQSEQFAFFIGYTGLVFDLAVGFLFLFRRTRIFALALMLIFHATNHFLIFDDIDWFPLAGIATAFIFLDADWPIRTWAWLKRPRFGRPDLGWLIPGVLLFPGVGALLGWKIRALPLTESEPVNRQRPGNWPARFVVLWLTWQALLPTRHYLIPGDARFTYEGLSFSWRLKTDRRSAKGALLEVQDPAILAITPTGRRRLDWTAWHGARVIHRRVVPGQIDWRRLPEVVVVLQPILGARVIYNPMAMPLAGNPPSSARARLDTLWRSHFGRTPTRASETLPLAAFCRSAADTLAAAGLDSDASHFGELTPIAAAFDQDQVDPQLAARLRTRLRGLLNEAVKNARTREPILELARQLEPFILEGQPRTAATFLVIDDQGFGAADGSAAAGLDNAVWTQLSGITSNSTERYEHIGGDPLIIYTCELGVEAGKLLPQAFIMDFMDNPSHPPSIFWNSLKDLSPSKSIHISNQAFFLRRYARRVASLWEMDHGRRPIINATTAVSLNGRPHQELVDPRADLASVEVKWFGHNEWIRDLQTPRIPRQVVEGK